MKAGGENREDFGDKSFFAGSRVCSVIKMKYS